MYLFDNDQAYRQSPSLRASSCLCLRVFLIPAFWFILKWRTNIVDEIVASVKIDETYFAQPKKLLWLFERMKKRVCRKVDGRALKRNEYLLRGIYFWISILWHRDGTECIPGNAYTMYARGPNTGLGRTTYAMQLFLVALMWNLCGLIYH